MYRAITVLLVFLLLVPAVAWGLEVRYTVKGGVADTFNPFSMTYAGNKILVTGTYTRYSANKAETLLAVIETTPDGRNFNGKLLSFSLNGSQLNLYPPGGNSFVIGSDDGYYILTATNGGNLLVVKTDKELNVRWGEELELIKEGNYGGHRDIIPQNAVLDDGNLYIVAITKMLGSSGAKNTVILKVSPEGNVLWVKVLTIGNLGLIPSDMVIVGDKIYLIGTSARTVFGGARLILVELLTNGTLLGAFSYTTSEMLSAKEIISTGDGFYVLGLFQENDRRYPAILKLDEDGNVIWAKRVNLAGMVSNWLVTADGSLYLSGVGSGRWGAGEMDKNVMVLKLDPAGNVLRGVAYRLNSLSGLKLLGLGFDSGIYGAVRFYGQRSIVVFSLQADMNEPCWDEIKAKTVTLNVESSRVQEKNLLVYIPKTRVYRGVELEISQANLSAEVLCPSGETSSPTETTASSASSETTSTSSETPVKTEKPVKTSTEEKKPSSASNSKSGGICGPGIVLGLALLPAFIRRR
ncbi:CGP-CTERM sorting domain-containing protein [Thermococcus sp. MAR1]|uniref:CGP-CTERM sorting domain-containing protein n=1 Tax=Thermococcus sp. MAR1 TaxID=1638263 RepID=UPI00143A37B2|nr:CGP-CTERM sorting domain-containing protein [Thermococcus sp. MAR1]NJE10824.1 CGP-CTERM sorting domain-containing protein [Thermococcus sp. MAR1]